LQFVTFGQLFRKMKFIHNYIVSNRSGSFITVIAFYSVLVIILGISKYTSANDTLPTPPSAIGLISQYKATGDTAFLAHAMQVATEAGDLQGQGEALRQMGLYFSSYADAEKAIFYLFKALEIFDKINDSEGLAKVNLNLGFIHYGLAETDLALDYTKRAVGFARKHNDRFLLSVILGNIGSMYERLEDGLEAALAAHNESLELSIQLTDSVGMFSTYNNLGVLYEKREQHAEALYNYNKALEMALALHETLEACRIRSNLASLNIRMGNFAVALNFLETSKSLCDSMNLMLQIHRLYLKSNALAGLGRYKEAFDTQIEYSGLNDSIFRVERTTAINELSQKYESEKKEQQISLLEKDVIIQKEVAKRETQKLHAILTIMSLVMLLALVLVKLYFDKNKLNKKLEILNSNLQASEMQLKALNESKDKFFGILSHDLRNPLAAFEKLSQKIATKQVNNQRDMADQMAQHARLLINLLNNVLIWSKSEQGLLTMKPQALLIHQLADEALSLYSTQASEKGLDLKNRTNPETMIFADRESLQTILRNLVNNAVKFTDYGTVSIISIANDDYAIVEVKDTGRGMSREQATSIFQLSAKQNAGLGLILCRELSEKNNIVFSVESQPGAGTIVSLKIPLFKLYEDSHS